jgi:branched-chain amino acid transport system ATP-binding protein
VTLLRVRDLTKQFGGLTANQAVNLTVEAGEIVGLIGPNGAGKTTLFSCIAGAYRPTSGSVWFDGHEVAGLPAHSICRLGVARTFQKVRILRDMTVLENVMVGAFCRIVSRRQAQRQAEAVLDLTRMTPLAHVPASSLTIADKKRLEIARALATQPKLLLLDEVMAGLNPREASDAVLLVRAIRERGITILMVEHVMEVIMPLSDRVLVLDGGELIAEGLPEEIARNERVIEAYLGT